MMTPQLTEQYGQVDRVSVVHGRAGHVEYDELNGHVHLDAGRP